MKDGNGNPLSPEQEAAIRNGALSVKEHTEHGLSENLVARTARKHGVGIDAVEVALATLRRGHGKMAQFSHPEFGGMAQWIAGGMSMVGDMFNAATKGKLDGVLHDLGARPSNDFGAIMTGRLGARFRCPVLILRLLQASGGCERYRSLPIRLGPDRDRAGATAGSLWLA
jgi:hypothetical protein